MSGLQAKSDAMILGFDPGRDKCGIAIMSCDRQLHWHQVVLSAEVLRSIQILQQQYFIAQVAMGNQTSAKAWKQKLVADLPQLPPITFVDERYSTLEARDRYWQMYPAQGLTRLIPQGMRSIPCPIDDIVAILLIERYLDRQLDRQK